MFLQRTKNFMKNFFYSNILKKCPLCAGIAESDLNALFDCLGAVQKNCPKDGFALMAGDPAGAVGIVLTGALHIVQEDFWGKRGILARLTPGELFGEAFACAGIKLLPVSVVATEAAEIMLLDYRKVIAPCPKGCAFHAVLVGNMLRILAQKNVLLVHKIEHLTRRSTREKLLSYLSAQAREAGQSSFVIPFNRQELADFLAVDRSAMSNELSKMQAEGILAFKRNEFELFKV